ncbi:hypothetical protein APS56_01265 [Pseudalgibacter alginicilyticus]|uniref:Uncharacterized protein n=1 Tax=Pseudalgibacter alginicilyticus TaxID=1736674 RepID=A0A0N7HXZ9_9FLAO|nr:hypothetical protein [Pseudalgibacter alginicilyticus]ALJ03862.1 hypothetical protein APS56_01265 [Pseudalgibacter alginicilyticus]
MNFLRKIRDIFERKVFLNEFYNDVQNLDEVLLEKRIEILKEIANPKFAEIGLKNWNGKYLWFSDFNKEGIKHVVEYNVLKGFAGALTFGNCFLNVPTLSGKKLINHRTEKSTKIIYLKKTESWQKSIETQRHLNPDKISTINEKKFRETLEKVLNKNLIKIENWFKENNTIEKNIRSLKKDAENPPFEIGTRIISFEYILAFLNKEKSEFKESEFWLNKHFKKGINSELEIEILTNKIKN